MCLDSDHRADLLPAPLACWLVSSLPAPASSPASQRQGNVPTPPRIHAAIRLRRRRVGRPRRRQFAGRADSTATEERRTSDADRTRPTEETREAERHEARTRADAGREPTADETRAADENELDEDVPEHYE